jgi:hypothetical protein
MAICTHGGLGVVGGSGTGLEVTVNSVVVAGTEGAEVLQSVEGDRVFGGVVSDSGIVRLDLAVCEVVRSLSSNEETIPTAMTGRNNVQPLETPSPVCQRLGRLTRRRRR